MGRIITLPGGVKFDPETGELIGADFGRPSIPSNSSYSYSSGNWWSRINNFVIGIGNWFAEHNANITGVLALILLVLAWLYFAISVIGIWKEDGFFSALIFGVIGGVIFYYVSMIAAGILIWVATIALAIVRFVFYNIYTLLLTLILIFCIIQCDGQTISSSQPHSISSSSSIQNNSYRCTARTYLRVRTAPNLQSLEIGKINNGEIIEVYDIQDGFAKIKYGDDFGYASLKYLQKIN